MSRAEALLSDDKITAVKVMSQRDGMNGGIIEAELLFKERAAREKPIQVSADNTPVRPCQEQKDFFALESRLAIGRLLRQFLDKLQITPSELLHSHRMMQRLDSTGNIATAALGRVANGQAQVLKQSARQRADALEKFAQQARSWARDYEAERKKLPPFDLDDLARVRRRLRAALNDELRGDNAFLCHLAGHLTASPSVLGKLDIVVELMGRATAAETLDLLEGVAADVLASPEALRDLVGAQPTLAQYIGLLACCVTGHTPETPFPDASPMPKLSGLMAADQAPQCRRVLVERLQVALASSVPLDQAQPENEATLLQALLERLDGGAAGLIGGEATGKAIAQRRQRQHTALRRKLGLD
ncbi:MAG: hypothetical protein IT562_08770 [Alphaproteobacteria bacterium]|nr:hypothetical protein [Alphaproteobacteria bacterium]